MSRLSFSYPVFVGSLAAAIAIAIGISFAVAVAAGPWWAADGIGARPRAPGR